MDDNPNEIEQQLLLAALVHGFVSSWDLMRANTYKIIHQVLFWEGWTREQILHQRNQIDRACAETKNRQELANRIEGYRSMQIYSMLVRMTQQERRTEPGRPPLRPGPALFQGQGNWGNWGAPGSPPSLPDYNSCRLTAHGERIARELLEQHPDYANEDPFLLRNQAERPNSP